MKPYQNCHYCGTAYGSTAYPHTCTNCNSIVYVNPLPIVVVAVPLVGYVEDAPFRAGLLGVRRNIHPVGEICLPGGYVEKYETWQEAAKRETWEETGMVITRVRLHDLISIDGFMCVLCVSEGIVLSTVDLSFKNEETQELVVLDKPQKLAFKVQTAFIEEILESM